MSHPPVHSCAASPLVELTGIAHRYGDNWVLRGVSFSVHAGEAVALTGRNGSGKTTLVRILATLCAPTGGHGRIAGLDICRHGAAVREVVAMLGHSPALYGDLTAGENLDFAMRMSGKRPDPNGIAAALDRVALWPHPALRVRDMSSGMQRRLALARLMLRDPRILLLDEPYTNLDADGTSLVDDLIAETTARGGAAIVVSHDDMRAGALDRVIRLEAGVVEMPPLLTLVGRGSRSG